MIISASRSLIEGLRFGIELPDLQLETILEGTSGRKLSFNTMRLKNISLSLRRRKWRNLKQLKTPTNPHNPSCKVHMTFNSQMRNLTQKSRQ